MKTSVSALLKALQIFCVCVVILTGCLFVQNPAAAESAGANILFILDGSGSMWGRLDNVEKIVIAKERMTELVQELEGVNMGLIVYGHRRKGDCNDIEVMVPLGAGNKDAVIQQIQSISPKGKTPITKSIELAAQQLETIEEETEIVLVSDGLETCEGDPCAYVQSLKEKGIKFKMDVVGFDVSEEERGQLECIAKAGGGRYFTAQNTMQLKEAFTEVKKEVVEKKVSQEQLPNVILVDGKTHHLGDDVNNHWDVPHPEGTSYTTNFWLPSSWTGGDILIRLDIFHVDVAEPVWINNQWVGIVPRGEHVPMWTEKWYSEVDVFVPGSVLTAGKNTLHIEVGGDDMLFKNLQIVTNIKASLDLSRQTQVFADNKIYHIGDNKVHNWAVPNPQGIFYKKIFSLNSVPKSDAILLLSSFDVHHANGVSVNDCYIGALPGRGTSTWTPEMAMRIPQSCLNIGSNVIQIDGLIHGKPQKGNAYDDFMVKDIRIFVTLDKEEAIKKEEPSVVLTSGLVAYYPFNGNANDESGNGNHGTVNGATLTTDRQGNASSAYKFNNSFIYVSESGSISPVKSITVAAWVYPTDVSTFHQVLTKRYADETDPYNSYILDTTYQGVNNKWRFCISNGSPGTQTCVADSDILIANQWAYLVGVYDGSYIKIYVNGDLKATKKKTGDIGYSSLPLRIGQARSVRAENFKGRIDDIRIYNYALSESEIQALYRETGQ